MSALILCLFMLSVIGRGAESVGVQNTLKNQVVNGFQLRKPSTSSKLHGATSLLVLTAESSPLYDSAAIKKLENSGASVFSDNRTNDEDNSLSINNARDNKYKLVKSKYNVISNAIAKGLMNHGFIQISPNPVEINDVVMSNSWVGNTVLQCVQDDGNLDVILGNSVNDVDLIHKIVNSKEISSTKSKESCKIAVVSTCSIFNSKKPCENPVTVSIQVVGEILKSQGFNVTFLRPKDMTTMNPADYDYILGPASSTGQLDEKEVLGKSKELTEVTSLLDLATDLAVFPCGVIADEDDGYGMLEYSDFVDREGLPVAACVVATKKNTMQTLLQIVRGYESVTRWSSEVFAPGNTRALAKEDMDDARESFGIYFVTTLMKYLGKKQNK